MRQLFVTIHNLLKNKQRFKRHIQSIMKFLTHEMVKTNCKSAYRRVFEEFDANFSSDIIKMKKGEEITKSAAKKADFRLNESFFLFFTK